ncbi:MAG: GNAT family N-acetyltransferase [Deltaproteobacteria bacterium]|nr:MAG: GNAT family N-acetyltransferase [Deltaproteobacteria bacterium]
MRDLSISFMQQKDISSAARALSVAMFRVPLHIAVFQGQGDKTRRELEQLFDKLLHDLPGIVFLAKADRRIVGVLRMKSCHGHQKSPKETYQEGLKDMASRVSYWQSVWAMHDPTEPHWHLGPVGVLPTHQGSGIGTALLHRFCQEVDACKAAAYLETDQLLSVRFYKKFDFKVVDEVDIFNVKNFFMWRTPRLQ